MKIVLVDDEPSIRLGLGDALIEEGFEVTIVKDGTDAWALLEKEPFDVVVTDIRMPGMNGRELLAKGIAQWPGTAFILMTGYGSVDDAVAAVKAGAYDYMTKPFDTTLLVARINRVREQRRLESRVREMEGRVVERRPALDSIIGRHPLTAHLKDRITTFGQSDATVLVTGETGTGKELVAKALHEVSERCTGPFVAVNSSAFPETLIDAELFGHERGAFTGAARRRAGRFQAAKGGTIFLDEIGELPLPAQAKLLRVLQESTLTPVGSDERIEVDVRVVAATNRDLKQLIADGAFREDLYYRLNVLPIHVPPLRERRSDLPALCRHFLEQFAQNEGRLDISPAAWAVLGRHTFPGNVRELRHAIEHGVILCRGQMIEPCHWPEDIVGHPDGLSPLSDEPSSHGTLAEAVTAFEIGVINQTLRMTGGRKAEAAQRLGISRKNLWEKLKRNETEKDASDSLVKGPEPVPQS